MKTINMDCVLSDGEILATEILSLPTHGVMCLSQQTPLDVVRVLINIDKIPDLIDALMIVYAYK